MTSDRPDPSTTPSIGFSQSVPVPLAADATPAAPVPINDDTVRRPDPNYVLMERLIGWIVAIVVAVGLIVGNVAVFGWNEDWHWGHGLVTLGSVVAMGGLCWLAHCWPAIEYRHRSYRVNDSRIEIRKGVLWRMTLDVPRSRVQHTDVNQGPIERRFGLAHLVIHTAGTTSASVTLEGLAHETAVRIRDHLVATGGDDAV